MSIKKNYGFNLLNSVLNIIFPIITFPYAARILSPDGIGEVQFIFSFAQYFSILAAFGLPIYGVKAIATTNGDKAKESKVASELILFSIITACIAFVIYCSFSIVSAGSDYKISTIVITGLLVLFGFLNVDWFFAGRQEFKVIALRSFIVKFIGLGILFTFVNEREDTFYYLIFLIFLYLGNYLLNFLFLIKRVTIKLKGLSFNQHLKPLLLIFSMALATTIYTTLDVVILGLLSNEREVGLYTSAIKLSKVSLPILTSLGIVVVPKATQYFASENITEQSRLLNKSFSFVTLLSIPMSFGIFLLSKETIWLFSGAEFLDAINDVRVLSCLPLFIGIGHFVSFQILLPMNKNGAISAATFIGMLLFLVLCFLLIPQNGSIGTAIATVATELIVTIAYLLYTPKQILRGFPWLKILKAFIVSCSFVPVVFFIRELTSTPAITFTLSVLCCTFIYFSFQHFIFKEPLVKEVCQFVKTRGNG